MAEELEFYPPKFAEDFGKFKNDHPEYSDDEIGIKFLESITKY